MKIFIVIYITEAKLERVSKKLKLDFASDNEDTDIDDFEPLPPLNLRQGLEGFFLLGSLDP